MTAIASTIDDGLSVIFSAEKAQLCTRLAMNRIPFSAFIDSNVKRTINIDTTHTVIVDSSIHVL
jgi:hypothetical protein